MKGKARMKHSDEGKLFVVKTIRISSEQEAGENSAEEREPAEEEESEEERNVRKAEEMERDKRFISSAFLNWKTERDRL